MKRESYAYTAATIAVYALITWGIVCTIILLREVAS